MVNQSVITAKIANIQKSLERLKEKQGISIEDFSKDRDIQDIVLFNLQSAIQFCVDTAGHIISDNNWGIPGSMAGLFDVLFDKKVISCETKEIMRSMVGFRNLIVHEYAGLDMNKVYNILIEHLEDFNAFLKEIVTYAKL